MEECLHSIFSRWLAWAHHAVDCDTSSHLILGFINAQALRDVCTLIKLVGIETLQILHACRTQLFQQHFSQLVVGLRNNFASILINDVARNHTPHKKVFGNADVCCCRLL